MQTVTYKCPCCGAPLVYDGIEKQLACSSCNNTFEAEGLNAAAQIEHEDSGFESMEWKMEGGAYSEVKGASTYICQSCGAELVTDETTTATECAYCGSPIILSDQLNDSPSPAYVLPFKVSEDEARKMFADYFHGKRLIPNVFQQSSNRISEIRRLYVPYWLFSCRADVHATYNATRVRSHRQGDYQITRTSHYLVRRTGTLDFQSIPVDSSEKLDDRITESLEPFDYSEAIPFAPATLSGSMADRPDVDESVCRDRANERLRESARDTFRSTVMGYATVVERSCSIRTDNANAVPVLLPVWLIRTEKTEKGEKKSYTFAINGQTGKLTCDVPFSKSKAAKWFFGVFAGVGAAGYALMYILAALGVIGGGLA